MHASRIADASVFTSPVQTLFQFSAFLRGKKLQLPNVHSIRMDTGVSIWESMKAQLIEKYKASDQHPIVLETRPEVVFMQPLYDVWNPSLVDCLPYSIDQPFDSDSFQDQSGVTEVYTLRHLMLREDKELNCFSLSYDNDFEWGGRHNRKWMVGSTDDF